MMFLSSKALAIGERIAIAKDSDERERCTGPLPPIPCYEGGGKNMLACLPVAQVLSHESKYPHASSSAVCSSVAFMT